VPDDDIQEKFREYRRTGDRQLRNELIEANRDVATRVARRYSRGRESLDDLVQVALLGVLKAVERFDPEHGVEFARFASVTADGELKRHFRDNTWTVHVPRTAQDLSIRLRPTIEHLSQTLKRAPSVTEIAAELDESIDHVLEALDASVAYQPASLDAPPSEGRSGSLEQWLGQVDRGFEDTDQRELVRDLLGRLPDRERRIVELRFFEDKVQSVIAEELGISQMHVSRLLARALGRMKTLAAEPPPG
jgi:RNA polymerase sigma-B factor